ncbi:hypothetical protein Bca52824_015856 [Brassica carinata]|uniref:Serine/threonine-protein kinase BSK n=1 Tax=Brassica carinata TaxID=52824 RepID=A0A8X8B5S7_BRACI|nr:hypothetical protein Bca52824_015856 [Brassica carinata]
MESQPQNQHGVAPPDSKFENEVMPFTKFFFSDLENVTHSFSVNKIVAVEGSNVVYKGNLQNIGSIAIKKFKTKAFPDPDKFEEEAKRVGELKHKRFVSLIGCCSDGDERLLVAEFLPNDTLAMRLFHEPRTCVAVVTFRTMVTFSRIHRLGLFVFNTCMCA